MEMNELSYFLAFYRNIPFQILIVFNKIVHQTIFSLLLTMLNLKAIVVSLTCQNLKLALIKPVYLQYKYIFSHRSEDEAHHCLVLIQCLILALYMTRRPATYERQGVNFLYLPPNLRILM